MSEKYIVVIVRGRVEDTFPLDQRAMAHRRAEAHAALDTECRVLVAEVYGIAEVPPTPEVKFTLL